MIQCHSAEAQGRSPQNMPTMVHWSLCIKFTWKATCTRWVCGPSSVSLNAGIKSPLWKVPYWLQGVLEEIPRLLDEGIQRQRAYINKMYYFFTDVLPWAILLFRLLTNLHPDRNFFVLSNLHKSSAPLSKKYKKLPILIISRMIICDLLHAHMKSIFLQVIWSCVNAQPSELKRCRVDSSPPPTITYKLFGGEAC